MEYRHEIKHLITQADAVSIRNNLRAVASMDPHAGKDGAYRIRSLYFDDLRDTALWEKLDGVNERRKFRIRYYNEDLSYIMLECKMKRDNVGCKLQERLTEDELRRIMAGDLAWMATGSRPLLTVLYVEMKTKGLRPRCVVEYMRVPFVYGPGNVRVTIDWNIRTGPPGQFMDPRGLTLPVEGNPMLLEVKWDEFGRPGSFPSGEPPKDSTATEGREEAAGNMPPQRSGRMEGQPIPDGFTPQGFEQNSSIASGTWLQFGICVLILLLAIVLIIKIPAHNR